MWQANKNKQNSRRMSGALLCAALLHVVLFFAIDRYAQFPDTALNSTRGKVTRIQLNLPQEQIEQDISSAEPPAKKVNQKAAEPMVETAHSPAPSPPNEQVESATEATPQQSATAPSKAESSNTDASGDSQAQASASNPGTDGKAERESKEQPSHQRTAKGIPHVSNRGTSRIGAVEQSKLEQQEFTVYLQQLIEEKRRYPRAARRRNIEGSVEFSVHVNRAGALAELTLRSSSGSHVLDKAAEDLLEKVFPVDYPLQENVQTTIRIIYKLTEV